MSAPATIPLPYPQTPRVDQIDDYFGTRVADPYRWLEDIDSPQTQRWIAEQNELAESMLATVPHRDAIRRRLTAVWNYERRSVPEKVGEQYAYFRNTGLQNQAVLYVTRDLVDVGRVLLDPNTFSTDGTVALSGWSFSNDGTRLAYSVSSSGSDWQEWRVRDVASGKDLSDIVRWGKFSGASWKRDGTGFYYSRYDEPTSENKFKEANYFHKVFFHRLGTPQSTDLLVYERPDHKDWNFAAITTEDAKYLVLDVSRGAAPENAIFVKELGSSAPVVELLPPDEARYVYIGNDEDVFYFQTTLDAPRSRVIAVSLDGGTRREIIAETEDLLDGASMFGERIVASYLHDALAYVVVYGLDGKIKAQVQLPGLGMVAGFGGKRAENETFYIYTSYTEPVSVYRLDVASGTSTLIFTPRTGFNLDAFTSEQVFYASRDGTRIPLIVTYKKGTPRDGTAPAILYGYGGFDVSVTPAFSSAALVWAEMGGVYAVANVRGGGEYGKQWHRDGIKEKKQNTFDDFIAAAEYLIAERWTSRTKLAIHGGSNGGLLVGACMTQRPELFAAALPSVGVLDMLRFQKFTIGWAWITDYGSSDDPEQTRVLIAYSPYHNVRAGTRYPATLIATADHDDRVFPAHSFKFAAALQHAQAGDAPILLRVETKAGHGAGKPTAKLIDEVVDRYAFLIKTFEVA